MSNRRCRALGLLAAISPLLMECTAAGGSVSEVNAKQQESVAVDPSAMLRIADAAEQSGDPRNAAAFYRRAADLDPHSISAQLGLSRALATEGRLDDAIATLQAARARHASAAIDETLGRLLVLAHRPRQAIDMFRDGLALDPASASMRTGEGVALDGAGFHEAAQRSYREVLASEPGNIAARNNLALSLALSGQTETAAGMLRDLLPESSPPDRTTIDGNLALVYGLQGDTPDAAAASRLSLSEQDVASNLRLYRMLRLDGATARRADAVQGGVAATGATDVAGAGDVPDPGATAAPVPAPP